ncbi:MAG TPA: MG2 domain-containing protein, partial [Niastella sp.]|nr:MG2 domain-containing protein [Niastella sp.]
KEEDAVKKNILQLETEIAASKEPVKAVLQSVAAQKYWSWFQRYRWQLYNRTQTVNFQKDDLATWSSDDFHKKIGELYLASLSNEKLLQQTKLEPFDAIIIKGNVRHLRPTLFDLLAHRALDYFKNNERNIKKAADAFEINDEVAFAYAKEFMNHTFSTTDSFSLQFKALQLYQRLLQFHAADTKPDAFIDADLARIEYVNSNAVMENKEALYVKALEQVGNKYEFIPPATQAWYLLAQWHVTQAAQYDPEHGNTNRDEYLKAMSICDKVIIQKDSSEGKLNCQNLVQEITRRELNLQTEKVNVPGQPFRTFLTWRNFAKLNFRVVKMDAKTKDALGANTWDDEYWKKLVKLPAVKTFSQNLPDTRDYQKHSLELKVDALPAGTYALVASVDDAFSIANNQMAIQHFYVSNIAYIAKGSEYFVVNRETGKPLANAKVQVWNHTYDYNVRKYTDTKGQSGVTNDNGFVILSPFINNTDHNYKLEIITSDDRLMLEDYIYNYTWNGTGTEQRTAKLAHVFTDRSIYRPGQTVYFKGILLNYNSKTHESVILPNHPTIIALNDPNGQQVASIPVTTNEYGAYSGKFILPTNVLNGQFTILDNEANARFPISVEEYKRPKFLVEISKPTGTYKLNENITVNGTAKAYAGNVIDGAKVKYRVVRQTIMPLWYGMYRKMIWPPYGQQEMEIAHGELITGAKGEFLIQFKAIPDNKVAKKDQPTFYYKVYADVTDIAGETRSANTEVAVAYQALKLSMNMPDKLHTDSLNRIHLTSTNLNDLFEKTTVTVSIHKLKTPDRVFRKRYWSQPDTFVLSQAEYYNLFPYDEYKDENQPSKWAKEQKVAERTDTTADGKPFTIDPASADAAAGRHSPLTAGWYIIEAITKDKYGEEVKDIKYVQLYNQNIVSSVASGDVESGKTTVAPGEKALYQVNT